MPREFSIRSLTSTDEQARVMDLQELVWDERTTDLLPLHTLIDLARNGSQIVGAFDGTLLVGFLVAFLGTALRDPHRPAMANLKLALNRLAVHPDYRGVGVGIQMMLRLRDIALQQAIHLITVDFDPLSSRDAYLLIRKLGVVVDKYVPDYYGLQSEFTDRLHAEWWVSNHRVEERLFGQRSKLSLTQYLAADTPLVNPSYLADDYVKPYRGRVSIPERSLLLIEIPASIGNVDADWRRHIRDILLTVIQHGFVATDFLCELYKGRQRAFYLMSYNGRV